MDLSSTVTQVGAQPILHESWPNSRQKRWQVLCLLEGAYRAVLPELDSVNFVFDVEERFDAVIASNFMSKGAFEHFIKHCSNPAAPMLAFSASFSARADAVLKDSSAAGLASAVLSLEPLIRRVSSLPQIPMGVDRAGLLVLALAYTRTCSIDARWQPGHVATVDYPLLRGIANARHLLEEMSEAGLLRRRFFERLHVCSHCESARMHAREVCVSCRSSHLVEHSIVHHYSCGFQAPQPAFEHCDGYLCPKCHKPLRHYGVDYDKPGMITTCGACGESMAEPEVGFVCVDCGASTPGDRAGERTWYHYDLTPDGISALCAGTLPTTDQLQVARGGHSLRDFRLLVTRTLPLFRRYGRPVSAWRLTIDTDSLSKEVGRRGVLEVCQLIRDITLQSIREDNIFAVLPTGIVCLQEADASSAKKALCILRDRIAALVAPSVNISAEIFEGSQIEALLEDLR